MKMQAIFMHSDFYRATRPEPSSAQQRQKGNRSQKPSTSGLMKRDFREMRSHAGAWVQK